MWQEKLVTLYCTVCQYYHSGISEQVQRLSNNFRPQFTDEEVVTVYLWGIIQRRFEVKTIYTYTKTHLSDWFPNLPSYQAFDRRLTELSPVFSALTERLMEQKPMEAIDMNMLLVDSMPILLAKASRSGHAKVAQELCAKTYNASRQQWYYGMKLHVVAQKRYHTLPFPKFIFASEASCHDLPIAKQIFEHIGQIDFSLVGDKAYSDADWKELLEQSGIHLLTPTKLKRGAPPPLLGGDAFDTSISRARQPIEAFFNWLHEKTGIQIASKVRSLKGLLFHIFGKLAAALFSLSFSFNS